MGTGIYVNLAVGDLERSVSFYTAVGARLNPQFTDENAAAVEWTDDIGFMLLTRRHFSTFTDKPLADASATIQAILALTRESRAAVDETIAAGIAAGGQETREVSDLGFMYLRSIDDPDGHALEFFFMEPAAVEEGPGAFLAQM